MNLAAEESKSSHERLAWTLVADGYAFAVLAGLGAFLIERLSDVSRGVGAAIAATFLLAGIGLLVLSAAGSLIAVWALWLGKIRSRPAVFALLLLGIVGVAIPGTLLATVLLRGQ